MMNYDKTVEGLIEYINDVLIPGMNPLQEIGARVILGELYEQRSAIKDLMLKNGIVKTFGIMDSEGNMNIERLLVRLKTEIAKKGKVDVSIPGYGKFTFKAEDIDEIYKYMKGETNENNI